ncbi:MAG: MlaD family protein [Betaproteobacteria bacterium]
MEPDKHYFIEGLFIIGFSIAAALFTLWLVTSGQRDDVLYRIHFNESVSGLALGDAVKYHGVDVGTVKALSLDADDPRRVQVDVKLRKEAPVKTDTKAILTPKGITGVVFIELNGGDAAAKDLVAVTPAGQIPEIPSEKGAIASILEQLPKVISKFSSIEDKVQKVVTDVGSVTNKIKDDPSLLLRQPKEKDKPAPTGNRGN